MEGLLESHTRDNIMHYDIYSDEYKVSMYHWKKFPQFAGLTEDEICQFMERVRAEEKRAHEVESKAKMKKERIDDVAYLESKDDKNILPEGSVTIEQGIIINPDAIDDHGFASKKDLSYQKGALKMSLDEHKKIYVKHK